MTRIVYAPAPKRRPKPASGPVIRTCPTIVHAPKPQRDAAGGWRIRDADGKWTTLPKTKGDEK